VTSRAYKWVARAWLLVLQFVAVSVAQQFQQKHQQYEWHSETRASNAASDIIWSLLLRACAMPVVMQVFACPSPSQRRPAHLYLPVRIRTPA
jgi:hypothetical protein